jgi:hypothetical protein
MDMDSSPPSPGPDPTPASWKSRGAVGALLLAAALALLAAGLRSAWRGWAEALRDADRSPGPSWSVATHPRALDRYVRLYRRQLTDPDPRWVEQLL